MTEPLDLRLATITPGVIEATIRQQAHAAQTRGLDAARLAVLLCDQAGVGPCDAARASAYPQVLARIEAAVAQLAGMRYVTGMT